MMDVMPKAGHRSQEVAKGSLVSLYLRQEAMQHSFFFF